MFSYAKLLSKGALHSGAWQNDVNLNARVVLPGIHRFFQAQAFEVLTPIYHLSYILCVETSY